MSRSRHERAGAPAHRRRRQPKHSDAPDVGPGAVVATSVVDRGGVTVGRRRRGRALWIVGAVVLVALVAVAAVQWFRPIPAPMFRGVLSSSIRFPGRPFTLPWPMVGSADVVVDGVGAMGESGSAQAVPVASITKVMTAYVVLHDHPISPGSSGPAIAVTPDAIAAYQTGLATQQSVVQVAAGESITELQALEGLLIASGNDLATLLSEWDAGSAAAFVAEMNNTAQSLGLTSTHFSDTSGFDPASVSTAGDLIRLGESAMAIPAFRQIVAMGEVDLPVAGLVYNFNSDLGQDGIIGIKTGSDSAAGGCLLFESQETIDGSTATVVGAVLGQQGSSPITSALDEAAVLVKAAYGAISARVPIAPGEVVGRVMAPWGTSVPVTAGSGQKSIGWPGLSMTARLHVGTVTSRLRRGARVGVVSVEVGGRSVDVPVRAARPLPGPSVLWRLTRF
jgi:serine-type D-Ala-D-Ala carboxypeptidase (penicillin-binding protein 5/6)